MSQQTPWKGILWGSQNIRYISHSVLTQKFTYKTPIVRYLDYLYYFSIVVIRNLCTLHFKCVCGYVSYKFLEENCWVKVSMNCNFDSHFNIIFYIVGTYIYPHQQYTNVFFTCHYISEKKIVYFLFEFLLLRVMFASFIYLRANYIVFSMYCLLIFITYFPLYIWSFSYWLISTFYIVEKYTLHCEL